MQKTIEVRFGGKRLVPFDPKTFADVAGRRLREAFPGADVRVEVVPDAEHFTYATLKTMSGRDAGRVSDVVEAVRDELFARLSGAERVAFLTASARRLLDALNGLADVIGDAVGRSDDPPGNALALMVAADQLAEALHLSEQKKGPPKSVAEVYGWSDVPRN